jgi:anthranilate phosphoribosyltransferase
MPDKPAPDWFRPTLSALLDRRDLSAAQAAALMEGLLRGEVGPVETAGLLVALRAKGETAAELAAAAGVLRAHGAVLDVGRDDLLDTCGTGGDGAGTFNVSTATAIVAAAAGAAVVKHGNRAVSSTSGSADVLAELGVRVSASPAVARRCLERAGVAFCLAPLYHPALAHVGEVRRRLGVHTLFNCLGPLANPARAAFQLLGVGRPEWLDRMAHALAGLGTRYALLVHGDDGLDEVSLAGPTRVRQVAGGEVKALAWAPADFGLAECGPDELRVGSPAESAAVIRGIFAGAGGGPTRVVLANAAAALLACGKARTLRDGAARAGAAVADGRARDTLAALAEASATVA